MQENIFMTQVTILPHVLDLARAGSDRWYVTNGATSVGPVNLDLLARGVEAGKVPVESFVRHEAWKVWRPLGELAEITDDEGMPVVGRPSMEDFPVGAARPSIPQDLLPSDAVAGAVDRRDALLLLLAAAVARGHAEVGMIHELNNDGAVTVSAHGPQVFEAMGMRTRLLDPALVAAAAGILVLAEPTPGPAGQAMIDRLTRLGMPVTSAVMLPIRPRGRLYGTIELGRRSPFRAIEVAGLEALVDALVFKLEALA